MFRSLERFKVWTRKGQTTSEYVIILGLVALGSIAVILLFGNQVRALFGAGTKKMAGQQGVTVQDYSGEADDKANVTDMKNAFEKD
jgi:Flp pilus assembly pilin Flp